MAKHIGIVAVSAPGAALCYSVICAEGAQRLGRHAHPEITLHTYPLSTYMRAIESGAWDEVGRLMLSSARKLAAAGAEILICPDNTAHEAFDLASRESPLPWLHIAREVAAAAAARGHRRVGLLGTRYLMEGPVYPPRLTAAGIECVVPEAQERERINAIIFEELVYGRLVSESRGFFHKAIRRLGERGCDAVILGCTEIPLLVTEEDSPLPALDSTRILARAALREATA